VILIDLKSHFLCACIYFLAKKSSIFYCFSISIIKLVSDLKKFDHPLVKLPLDTEPFSQMHLGMNFD